MSKMVFILFLVLSFSSYGASDCINGEQNCWDCGKTDSDLCTARLNGTTLSITGTGKMEDYGWTQDENTGIYITNAPWGNTSKGNTEIENIIVGGITRIGESAFLGATSLENITFSDSVECIGRNALHSSGLTHIDLPPNLKTLEGGAIENSQFIHEIVLPDGLETIGNGGFYGWRLLETIVIPDSVTTLGAYVFSNCSNLKTVVIGSGVEQILHGYGENYGFENTPLLENVYCQASNRQVCADALSNSGKTEEQVETMLKTYVKDQETGIYQTSDGKYFASSELMGAGKFCATKNQCAEIVEALKYNQVFNMNGKFYASLSDWAKDNYIKKRIYTIDEANAVAGEKNRVSIKYR